MFEIDEILIEFAEMKIFRRIDRAILRPQAEGVRYARGLYGVAKVYAARIGEEGLKTHVQLMQRTLVPRRKKPAVPADPETAAKK